MTKQYYMTGQYSRFVRPGFKRVRVVAGNRQTKVTAYVRGTRLVIVALNLGGARAQEDFRIGGVPGITRMQPVRTDLGADNWRRLPDVRLDGDAFRAVLPPQSVTTFVSRSAG